MVDATLLNEVVELFICLCKEICISFYFVKETKLLFLELSYLREVIGLMS